MGILSSLGSIGWFGEHISVQQWIGGALIVANVMMVALAGLSNQS